MEEISFAEKLRIQAKDKKAAILDDFITRTVTNVKTYAEAEADKGKFKCDFVTDSIPEAILSRSANRTTIDQVILDIIHLLVDDLESCRFTKLVINKAWLAFGTGSSVTALTITCIWD